ncbi:MAG: hypothetical protein ACI91B_000209 [Planctomycetota bacterium]|jgi:hypothetical protein
MNPSTTARTFATSLFLLSALAAQNLVANPGFESGNGGFSSDYGYSAGSNCCEGQYTVRNNGNTFNGAFVNPPPASPGSSNMMVINGSTVPNERVWYVSVAVTTGTLYRFELAGCTAVQGGPGILQWQVDGSLIGTPLPLPAPTGIWQVNGATWVATQTGTVEVAIRNLNTNAFPNDFYIDDIFIGACSACWDNYGSGFPGSAGIPNLVPSAPPVIGTSIDFVMTSVRSVPALGVLVLGTAVANATTPFGGTLLATPNVLITHVVPAAPASGTEPFMIPNNGGLVGFELFAQFAHLDPTASAGFAFSRGLRLRLGN